MLIISAPSRVGSKVHLISPSIFLAGSIDMGTAINWQKKVEEEFQYFPGIIFNPRRDDWDSSWKQEDVDPQFRAQVDWELDYLRYASKVFMFISKESKAPITLLEFGYIAHSFPEKLTICVEDGFYRRGNIEVVCRREGIPLQNNLQTTIDNLKIQMAAQL